QGQLELSGHNSSTPATITIDGGGVVTVDGNDASRVFQVDAAVHAAFANLTITNGNADNSIGGGIYNAGGTGAVGWRTPPRHPAGRTTDGGGERERSGGGAATVGASTISGDGADRSDGDGGGGGIYNAGGTVTVSGSPLSGNHADFGRGGGGIYNAGGGTV